MSRLDQKVACAGNRTVATGAPVRRARRRAVAAAAVAAATGALAPWGGRAALAASDAWSTAPSTGNFGDANWTLGATVGGAATGTVASGDSLFFDGSTIQPLTNNNVGFSYAGLTFNGDAAAYTIGGNAFTLTGAITDYSNASAQAINTTGITLGATQTVNVIPTGGSLTLGGSIGDGGGGFGLTKTGFGALTLSGSNGYTGTTTLGTGTLNLTGSLASTALVLGNATFNDAPTVSGTKAFTTTALNGGATFTVATGSTLTLGTLNRTVGGTLLFNRSSATGTLNATAGTNAAVLNGVLPWADTFSAGTPSNSSAGGFNFANYSGGSIVPFTGATAQASFNFTGTTTGNYDVNAGNSGGLSSSRQGNTMRYIGATDTLKLNNLNTSLSVNGLMNAGAAGNTLTISGGYLNASNAEMVLTAASGNITVSSPIYNANSTATGTAVTNSATATTLTISGYGTNAVLLSGANVYSGGTVLSSGELDLSASTVVTSGTITSGPIGTGTLTIYGGSLNPRIASRTIANPVTVDGDFYFYVPVPIAGNGNNITMTGSVDLGGATRTIYTNSGAAGVATLAGVVSDGGLTKAGPTTLALTGVNTYAGPTTITGGTLQLGDGTNDGTIVGNGGVNDGGTLAFNWANAHSVGYGIFGSGNVTKAGAGTLTFTTGQTYTGATAVNGGRLNLAAGNSYATGAMSVGATATLATTGSAGTTAVAGSLSQVAGGTIDLRNGVIDTLTFGNGLTLNGGTLGFDIGAGTGDAIHLLGGAYSGNGSSSIVLTSLGATAGTYDLLTGVTNVSAANFTLAAGILNGLNATLSVVDTNSDSIPDDLRLTLASSGAATTAYWNVNGSASFAPASFSANADGTGAVSLIDQTSAIVFSSNPVNTSGTAKVASLTADQSIRTLTDNDTAAVTINGPFNLTIADPAGLTVSAGAGPLTIATGAVTLGATQTWTNNSSNPAAIAAPISGTGFSLTFAGGKFVLGGASTYTGLTTVNAGATLQLGDGTNDGTIAGTSAVTDNGSLVFAPAGSQTAAYAVAGTGSITMAGTGTQTLSHASTYTGGTFVTSGTLRNGVANALSTASALTVAGTGATYDLNGFNQTVAGLSDGGVTTGTITASSAAALTVNNATTSTYGGTITGPVTLVKAGVGTLTLSGSNSYTGGTNMATGAGVIVAQNSFAFGSSGTVAQATTTSTRGNGIQLVGGLTFPAGISFVTSNDGSIAGVTYAIDSVSGNNTINGNIGLTTGGGGSVFESDAGTFTINGNITITAAGATSRGVILTGASAGPNAINGVISNLSATAVNSVTKNTSTGLWILNGANTYNGSTSVIAGTLRAGIASAADGSSGPFGSFSATTVANDPSAVLDLNNFSVQVGSLAGGGAAGGAVTMGSGTLTTGGNNASTAFAGAISGTGGLVKVGTGTQTLTGSQTFSGPTTISAGGLTLGDGTTDGSLNTTGVIDNGAFTVNRIANATIAYPISGTGSFAKQGTGTLTLTGANTYSGPTTIVGGGILSVSSIGATTSTSPTNLGVPVSASVGAIFLAGVSASGELLYTGTGETTDRFVGITGGTAGATNGILDQSGTGNLVFTGNVYASGVAHTLVLQGSTTGTGEIDGPIANNTSSMSLLKQGTGTWTLTGTNTYTGGSTITAGTLRANNATSSLGAGTTNVSGGVLAGTGNTGSGAIVINGGAITAGTGATVADAIGVLTTGYETWNASGSYVAKLDGTNTTNDRLIMSGLTANGGFTVNIVGANASSASGTYILAVDTTGTPGTTFNTGALTLQVNGAAAPSGWGLSDVTDTTGLSGDDLVLSTSAAPEPTSLLLAALAATPLALGRRRSAAVV